MPGIASIKIPGLPTGSAEARAHLAAIRAAIPNEVTIGVSGDAFAAAGLTAGCDAWYSVIAGTLPEPALALTRATQQGRMNDTQAISDELAPLWALFSEHGSLRVVAAIAEHLGLVRARSLPLPIQGLDSAHRASIIEAIDALRRARDLDESR